MLILLSADRVRFGRVGSVEGYCTTAGAGKPVTVAVARVAYLDEGAARYRPFAWRVGVRSEDALLKRPPL